uniref:Large ribosomal subunit protein eL8 n=1 Tax=Parastrongyloides trichosuri TaxID=131310 RepID=A0A0N4Z8N6_PARTI
MILNSHRQISRNHDPIDRNATEILMKSIRGIPYLIQAIQYSMETSYYPDCNSELGTTAVIHTAPGCKSVLDCDSEEEREEMIKRISPRNSGPEEKWLPEDPKKWTNQQLRLSMNRTSQTLLVFPYSESNTKGNSFDKDSNLDVECTLTTPRLSFETSESPQPSTKKVIKKKVAAVPAHMKGKVQKKPVNPLFEKRPRNFGIGGAILPEKDLTHFVKWPKYIRLQRQKAVLSKRLKIPPTINQFRQTLDKNNALNVFKLFDKYAPESKQAKKERLAKRAEEKAAGKPETVTKRPNTVAYGIKDVTRLVETKKATFVAIAFDVDPIEIALFLPALCRKFAVPYVIVKDKSRLGKVVGKKTTSCIALTKVNPEDNAKLQSLVEVATNNFNGRAEEIRKHWGGAIMSARSQARKAKFEKVRAAEIAAKI